MVRVNGIHLMFMVFSGGTFDLWIGASVISVLHLIIYLIADQLHDWAKRIEEQERRNEEQAED